MLACLGSPPRNDVASKSRGAYRFADFTVGAHARARVGVPPVYPTCNAFPRHTLESASEDQIRMRCRLLAHAHARETLCSPLLVVMPVSGRASMSTEPDALHRPLEHRICLQFPIVRAVACLETLAERVFPSSAEAGILAQMGVRGIPRYVRGLAREDHLRIPAKRRKERFPPRECPWY